MNDISRKVKIIRELFDDEGYTLIIRMYAGLYRDIGNEDFAIMACELIDNIEPGEGD